MSSSDEKEAFEVTDYDLDNEFNPNRRRRKATKNDMIYGVFNDSEDEEDEPRRGRGGKEHNKAAPSFVSAGSGVKAGKKGKKAVGSDDDLENADDDEDGDDENADDDEVLRREFGFLEDDEAEPAIAQPEPEPQGTVRSARTFKAGVAPSKPSTTHPARRAKNPFLKTTTAENTQPNSDASNQEFARRVLESADSSKDKDEGRTPSRKDIFKNTDDSMQGKTETPAKTHGYSLFRNDGPKKVDKNFATFEKSTKGIGSKLLEKMGWKAGEGLGRHKQGISAPIEVIVRPKGQALQETKERTQQSKEIFKSGKDSDDEFQEEMEQWKVASGTSKTQRPKYKYVVPEEIASPAQSGMKIVDMTGATTRIISDGALKSMPALATVDASLPMPELQHNIRVLTDTANNDVVQRRRRLLAEKDKLEHLQIEKQRMDKQMKTQTMHSQRLREIMGLLEEVQQMKDFGTLDLSLFVSLFLKLQTNFPDEYRLYGLANVAVAVAFPLIEKSLLAWDLLANPTLHLETFKTWKTLLSDGSEDRMRFDEQSLGGSDAMTYFERLCWNVLLPYLRRVVTTTWNPRQFDPIILFVEQWSGLLPKWIVENVLQQLIFPRLEAEVELWNPREDFMPVHAWLHPWLPLLKSRLESFYPQIRYKLGMCLQAWHPSDSSAKAIIAPWKGVFSNVDMNTFLARFISPKVTLCMKEFVINPANQAMQLFDWVMAWRDLLPLSDLAQILEQHFFPKFLAVLCEWLSAPSANFMAISQWYTFWKQRFDAEILAVSTVKASFKRALDIMNRAVSGDAHAAETQPPTSKPTTAVSNAPPPSLLSQFAAERSIDLKHLVQQLADDNNILYMPKPGRSADGKALFTFGKLLMFIERDVIFAKDKASPTFRPVSLQDLVQLSQ